MRVARYFLFGILALVAVLAVLILTVDLGRFKTTVENLASESLNRNFAIGGEFHVDIGRRIDFVVEDAQLADAQWTGNELLASVGRLEGSIDTWSLFTSTVQVESLRVDAVRVNLQSSESGETNWTFAPPQDEAEPEADADALAALPAMLKDALISDLVVTYNSPQRPQPLVVTAAEIRLSQEEEGDALTLDITGDVNETPVTVKARATTVENLIRLANVDLSLSGGLGEISFQGTANVDDLQQPTRPTASLKLQGPNAEYLTSILQVQEVTTGPLDLTATIAPVDGKVQLLLNGTFGEFSVDASGQLAALDNLEEFDLRVAASGPDAGTIARLIGNDGVPADPFSIVGTAQRSGSVLAVEGVKVTIGKTQFDIGGRFDDFPDPRGARANLQLSGPDFGRFNRLLGLPGKLTGPFTIDGSLAPVPGGGAAVNLTAVARDVQLKLVGEVKDKPDFVGTRIELTTTGPDLRTITTALGLEQAPAEAFELVVVVERVAEGAAIETGTLSLPGVSAQVSGLVGNDPLEAGTDIRFEISGPNLASTLAAFGRDADELPAARFKAGGRIERGPENFVLHDVQAAIGDQLEYVLNIDGQVSSEPQFVGTRLAISASGKSLGALTDAAGIEGIPDKPFEVSANIERMTNGVAIENGSVKVGADRMSLNGLIADKPLEGDTDLSFQASAPDLRASLQGFLADAASIPAGAFSAAGAIRFQKDHFALKNLKASLAGTNLTVDGRLGTYPEFEGTRLSINTKGADLSALLPEEPRFSAMNQPFGFSAQATVRKQQLSLDDVAAFIGETKLNAGVGLRLSPTLDSGSFTVNANSPDVFVLVPELAETSVHKRAAMDLKTKGAWSGNVLTLNEFALQLAEGKLVATGTVAGPPNFDKTELRSSLDVASVRNFSVLAGRELPDESAKLQIHLTGAKQALAVEQFEGTLGLSDFSGSFSMREGDVRSFELALNSKRLNLAPYLPASDEQATPEQTVEPEKKKSDRVIPDTPIPIEELAKYQAVANIEIGELNLKTLTLSDIAVHGELAGGALKVSRFSLTSPQKESLSGQLRLEPAQTGARLLLAVDGSELALGLPATTDEEMQARPRYDVDTVLLGTGTTVRELAGSLNGYLHLVAGPGDVKTTALKFLTNDFVSTVFNTVNPFAKSDAYAHYECAVVLARIDDGKVSGKPVAVIQSDRLRIFANADIDLKTEKLEVEINTVPTKGLGLSFSDLVNPYTKIGGTLASPTLVIDPEGALVQGGAAVATGGISILAKRFKDRFLETSDPCGKAVADTQADFQAIRSRMQPEIAQ